MGKTKASSHCVKKVPNTAYCTVVIGTAFATDAFCPTGKLNQIRYKSNSVIGDCRGLKFYSSHPEWQGRINHLARRFLLRKSVFRPHVSPQ